MHGNNAGESGKIARNKKKKSEKDWMAGHLQTRHLDPCLAYRYVSQQRQRQGFGCMFHQDKTDLKEVQVINPILMKERTLVGGWSKISFYRPLSISWLDTLKPKEHWVSFMKVSWRNNCIALRVLHMSVYQSPLIQREMLCSSAAMQPERKRPGLAHYHGSPRHPAIMSLREFFPHPYPLLASLNFYTMASINLCRPSAIFPSTRPRERKLLVFNDSTGRLSRINLAGMKPWEFSSPELYVADIASTK